MKHHTKDLSERVFSISVNIAEKQYKKDGNIQNYFKNVKETYDETLMEFVYGQECSTC